MNGPSLKEILTTNGPSLKISNRPHHALELAAPKKISTPHVGSTQKKLTCTTGTSLLKTFNRARAPSLLRSFPHACPALSSQGLSKPSAPLHITTRR
jgi:hypothetical protein